MPAYKNKENGSWYVVTQYTDWTGSRKPKCKRGFSTKREAQEWEQKFQQQSLLRNLYQRSQGTAERKYMANQGEYYSKEAAAVFRQAENLRDHHKRCNCMAE